MNRAYLAIAVVIVVFQGINAKESIAGELSNSIEQFSIWKSSVISSVQSIKKEQSAKFMFYNTQKNNKCYSKISKYELMAVKLRYQEQIMSPINSLIDRIILDVESGEKIIQTNYDITLVKIQRDVDGFISYSNRILLRQGKCSRSEITIKPESNSAPAGFKTYVLKKLKTFVGVTLHLLDELKEFLNGDTDRKKRQALANKLGKLKLLAFDRI